MHPPHSILVIMIHLLIITSFICQKEHIVIQHKGNTRLQVGGLMKSTGVKTRVNISASQKQHIQFDFLNHSLHLQETQTPAQISQQIFYMYCFNTHVSLTSSFLLPSSVFTSACRYKAMWAMGAANLKHSKCSGITQVNVCNHDRTRGSSS